jgi:superfamily II DNA/RNA helicase
MRFNEYKDPEYISVHALAQWTTPQKLLQNYLVCELHEKIDILWSFIKRHLRKKTLVFVSSQKQVRPFFVNTPHYYTKHKISYIHFITSLHDCKFINSFNFFSLGEIHF